MTHPSLVVQEAIFLYCHSIAYLLENPESPNRAQEAFEEANKIVKDEACREWLNLSLEMSKSQKESEENIISNFMDTREMCGWLKHSFVLSFYFLLRYQAFVESSA